MFSARDPDGHFTTRLDVCSDVIDWWDYDDQRTTIDPGSGQVASGGSEDNIYSQLSEPYPIKNAPFDSLEELRLIRGIGEDFWATFVDPKPDDPRARNVTIYGSGAVNVNLAQPEVLLARLCSFLAISRCAAIRCRSPRSCRCSTPRAASFRSRCSRPSTTSSTSCRARRTPA